MRPPGVLGLSRGVTGEMVGINEARAIGAAREPAAMDR